MSGSKKKREANLMPIEEVNSRRTREKHSSDSKKGGIKSGKTRRKQRLLKDIFATLLDSDITDEKSIELISEMGLNISNYKELLALATLKQAIKGDVRAIELVQRTIGEHPKEEDPDEELLNKLDTLLKAQEADDVEVE